MTVCVLVTVNSSGWNKHSHLCQREEKLLAMKNTSNYPRRSRTRTPVTAQMSPRTQVCDPTLWSWTSLLAPWAFISSWDEPDLWALNEMWLMSKNLTQCRNLFLTQNGRHSFLGSTENEVPRFLPNHVKVLLQPASRQALETALLSSWSVTEKCFLTPSVSFQRPSWGWIAMLASFCLLSISDWSTQAETRRQESKDEPRH